MHESEAAGEPEPEATQAYRVAPADGDESQSRAEADSESEPTQAYRVPPEEDTDRH